MYTNIILSIYDPEFEEIKGLTSFNHLLIALKIPVFTSEVNIIINYFIKSGVNTKFELKPNKSNHKNYLAHLYNIFNTRSQNRKHRLSNRFLSCE